ncbi:MAG: TonB-dependent receptor [Myxococcales bacterium]|nr:TonB-dependent receptor [Myxococcales bacterium]
MKMVMYLARWLVALTFIALVAAVHERAAAQESPEDDRIEDEAPAQEQESSDEPAKSQESQEPLEGPEGMEGSEPVAPPDGTLPPEPELPPLPESAEGVRAADYGAQAPEPSSDPKPAPRQTADTREEVEEIVVTADRRTSNLQEYPGSVSALSQRSLDQAGINSIRDLTAATPYVQLGTQEGNTEIFIRGVGSNNNTELGDPAAAMHFDGIYIPRPRGVGSMLYDVERVEISRGPQGTLRGRNATAGAVNVVTRAPELAEWGAAASLQLGNYTQRLGRAMVNIPVGEQLAVRLAAYHETRDPFYTNAGPIYTLAPAESADTLSYRASALWAPLDAIKIVVRHDYTMEGGTGNAGTNYHPALTANVLPEDIPDPRAVHYRGPQGDQDVDHWGVSGDITVDFGPVSVGYLGAYRDLDYEQIVSGNAGVDYPGMDMPNYDDWSGTYWHSQSRSIVQELRLYSPDTDALRWNVGGFFFAEEQKIFLGGNGDNSTGFIGFEYNHPQMESTSYAGFADASYDILDALRAIAGVRYTQETKERHGIGHQYGLSGLADGESFRFGTEGFRFSGLGRTDFGAAGANPGRIANFTNGVAAYGARDTLAALLMQPNIMLNDSLAPDALHFSRPVLLARRCPHQDRAVHGRLQWRWTQRQRRSRGEAERGRAGVHHRGRRAGLHASGWETLTGIAGNQPRGHDLSDHAEQQRPPRQPLLQCPKTDCPAGDAADVIERATATPRPGPVSKPAHPPNGRQQPTSSGSRWTKGRQRRQALATSLGFLVATTLSCVQPASVPATVPVTVPVRAAETSHARGSTPPPTTPAAAPSHVHPERWPRVRSPLPRDPALEARITGLLAALTLEQKVGQLIQADIGSVTPEDLRTYPLGSILNGGNSGPMGDDLAPPARWLAAADAYYEAARQAYGDQTPIPLLWGTDAVHGHANIPGATVFPHNVGLGAANDPDLIRRIGEITAVEVAVTGQDWTFAPTLAVVQDVRWGRSYESYGADPALVRTYADAMVSGLQGAIGASGFLDEAHVLATAKHFIGDGGTGGVDQGDTAADEGELIAVHNAGYPAAIAAGVQTVMVSFSSWQGEKLHGHRGLLTDVLKQRMGFDGIVVGDWNGHGQVPGCTAEHCTRAFTAGLDMLMAPDSWKALYHNTLADARSGVLPLARIDDAVRRILRVKLRAGLFSRGKPSSRRLAGRFELLAAKQHRAVAREAVRKSLVLLKNEGQILPLSPSMRILVTGDGAHSVPKQCGGWTLSWQGTGLRNDQFPAADTIYGGLERQVQAAGGHIELSVDGRFRTRPDVAIVVFGEDPYAEFAGDAHHHALQTSDGSHMQVLRKLAEQGVKTVAVMLSGRPLWVNRELNLADAFVAAWLPGAEGAGVADVLLRTADDAVQHDFVGRLPFPWPAAPRTTAREQPLFAHGHGLQYGEAGDLPALPTFPSEIAGLATDRLKLFVRGQTGHGLRWFTTSAATPKGEPPVVVTKLDHNLQEGARRLEWTGPAAHAGLQAQVPMDLRREANGDMVLAFSMRLTGQAPSPIKVMVACGPNCQGVVPLDARLDEHLAKQLYEHSPQAEADSLHTVRVPLRCFARAGADLARVTAPFALNAQGPLSLIVGDVRLESSAPLPCPATLSITGAAADEPPVVPQ